MGTFIFGGSFAINSGFQDFLESAAISGKVNGIVNAITHRVSVLFLLLQLGPR
nr:hypothetical protein [Xenorhabdus budapestensis]